MAMKKWVVGKCDRALAKELAAECDTDPIVALIAAGRGLTDPMELEQFLSDEPFFQHPSELADIQVAARLLEDAVAAGTKIAVFGDYDCDGVTATAILCHYLRGRGADCIYRIPDRFAEGYGMSVEAVEEMKEAGVGLIVTVDNGIACHREIARAKELGMTVIVTDHHLSKDTLPEADAVVDPHRKDCPSSFKEICGAQVAFALICMMENREPEELIPYYADILCVAVLADVMPLVLENRCIVKYGVEKLRTSPAVGLSAVMNVAGLDRKTLDAGRVAFGIAPRLNAAGRMGDAGRAVELLLADTMMTALTIANEIDADNALRQKTEKEIFLKAITLIEQNGYGHDRVIVVAGEGWHIGVIGIVASRIAERYGRPAIVISIDGEKATGSGRSVEGFPLFETIAASSEMLSRFGGHQSAAGVGLPTEAIPQFREKINETAALKPYIPPTLHLDCKLTPAALTVDLAEALRVLEPFGPGNQAPVFGLFEVTLVRATPIGQGKHLRLIFSKGENSFQALLFGVTADAFCFEPGDVLDAAVTVEPNLYNGVYSVTVQIKALRMSGLGEEVFAGMEAFDDFMSGRSRKKEWLLPSRAEIGEIYKTVAEKTRVEERIKYLFSGRIGYGKTMVSLAVLEELGLIVKEADGRLHLPKEQKRNELQNSGLYRRLTERGETV